MPAQEGGTGQRTVRRMAWMGWGAFISNSNDASGSRTSRWPVDTGIILSADCRGSAHTHESRGRRVGAPARPHTNHEASKFGGPPCVYARMLTSAFRRRLSLAVRATRTPPSPSAAFERPRTILYLPGLTAPSQTLFESSRIGPELRNLGYPTWCGPWRARMPSQPAPYCVHLQCVPMVGGLHLGG